MINPALDQTLIVTSSVVQGRTRPVGLDEAVEAGRNRIVLVAVTFLVLFAVLSVRLFGLAVSGARDHSFISASSEPDLPRADILDRRGTLVATDVGAFAAYADPSRIWDAAEAADRITGVLARVDRDRLFERLSRKSTRFVWVERELTPRERYEVHNLGLPGIDFMRERKRFYPHGTVLSHVVGYTTIDGKGIAGAELAFDPLIRGRTQADAPVRLSVDLRVQHALHQELASALDRFRARSAAGVVLDVRTGEVMGMVSLPDFDPNAPGEAGPARHFNRVVGGVYELGSTLKAFTIAAALDSATVSLLDGFDATHPIKVGRHQIRDFHPKRRFLTVPEIFRYSSNIGTAKMAIAMGLETQKDYLDRFGLLERPPFELKETARPITPERWGELQRMTVSFGHGIAISPLQLSVGGAALVNGGCLPRPTLISAMDPPGSCARAVTPATSRIMLDLMRAVVVEGTGKRADVEGYPVAGKTGTAEKARDGGYDQRAILSSFMGVFPANDPAYVVLVVLDEPKPTEETFNLATAGWTAAPLVGRIVARIAPMLGVPPVLAPSGAGHEGRDRSARRVPLDEPVTGGLSTPRRGARASTRNG
ncbi:MAG: peptidoglycan D,D-transpeptidase FtsI family protein [Alphaproteobacteria bacterium]